MHFQLKSKVNTPPLLSMSLAIQLARQQKVRLMQLTVNQLAIYSAERGWREENKYFFTDCKLLASTHKPLNVQ